MEHLILEAYSQLGKGSVDQAIQLLLEGGWPLSQRACPRSRLPESPSKLKGCWSLFKETPHKLNSMVSPLFRACCLKGGCLA